MLKLIFNESQKLDAIQVIHDLDYNKKWQIEIKPYRKNRSVAQNKLYHMWLKEISLHTGDTTDGLHEHFKNEYLDTEYIMVMGKSLAKTKTTTTLNTKEFTEYLEKIEHFAWHFLNMTLSHPEELYLQALLLNKKGG